MLYFDLNLNPNSNNNIKLEDNWNTFLYVYEGTAEIGGRQINNGQMAVLSNKSDLNIRSLNSYLKCVIISGEPINEPVSRGGPFVMNTRAEILQAFQDYEKEYLLSKMKKNLQIFLLVITCFYISSCAKKDSSDKSNNRFEKLC